MFSSTSHHRINVIKNSRSIVSLSLLSPWAQRNQNKKIFRYPIHTVQCSNKNQTSYNHNLTITTKKTNDPDPTVHTHKTQNTQDAPLSPAAYTSQPSHGKIQYKCNNKTKLNCPNSNTQFKKYLGYVKKNTNIAITFKARVEVSKKKKLQTKEKCRLKSCS
jgi:hypothetical protein